MSDELRSDGVTPPANGSDVSPSDGEHALLPDLPVGLRYVDSPDAWHDEVLASAMDELRRGRSGVASVTAARLSRTQADVLLRFIEDLKHDLEMALAEAAAYALRDSERWIHRVAGAELHRLYGHTTPYPTCGDSMCMRTRRYLDVANADTPEALARAIRAVLGTGLGVQRFYFTFGSAHPYANNYLVIEAPSFEAARAEMFDRFGREWAFEYDEDGWTRVGMNVTAAQFTYLAEHGATQAERYGLTELPRDARPPS